MRVVGLTGGIASGKSTATKLFREQGVPVIDCDEAARDVVLKGTTGHQRLLKLFGQEVLQSSGEIDRAKLGELVFADAAKRKQLNAALHPLIMLRICTQLLHLWLWHASLVVVDMPLLFETKSHRFMSTSMLVTCPEDQQAERLMARDGCTAAQAQQKLASQMSLKAKSRLAGILLDNSGRPQGLRSQVERTVTRLRAGTAWHLLVSPSGLLLMGMAAWALLHRAH